MTKMVTADTLLKIMPYASKRVMNYLLYLNAGFYNNDFSIEDIRGFIAQIAVESGELKYVEELASGEAYEGRTGLGNTQKGDGKKYKGRGLLQITGRRNYTKLSNDLGVDFVNNPELLKQPKYAVDSAFWYWKVNNLKGVLQSETLTNFKYLTKRINGGYNGLEARLKYWEKAKKYIVEY